MPACLRRASMRLARYTPRMQRRRDAGQDNNKPMFGHGQAGAGCEDRAPDAAGSGISAVPRRQDTMGRPVPSILAGGHNSPQHTYRYRLRPLDVHAQRSASSVQRPLHVAHQPLTTPHLPDRGGTYCHIHGLRHQIPPGLNGLGGEASEQECSRGERGKRGSCVTCVSLRSVAPPPHTHTRAEVGEPPIHSIL